MLSAKTYALLRNLVEPDKLKDKSFQALAAILEKQLNPKLLVISERFPFHTRNHVDGESVVEFCAQLKKLSTNFEVNNKRLREVLKRLQYHGLHVNLNKCEFWVNKIEYCGHLIDKDGLHPTEKKVRAILDAPQPTNVTQLKSFLRHIDQMRSIGSNIPLSSDFELRFPSIPESTPPTTEKELLPVYLAPTDEVEPTPTAIIPEHRSKSSTVHPNTADSMPTAVVLRRSTRIRKARNQSNDQYLSVHKDTFSNPPTNRHLEEAVVIDWSKMMKFKATL
ncbi:hypothetical protein AVEN_60228-1 [Araneus ventricosus]|uniref:Reverse transcriptase domain-containing protein n=1 Tax=Araneus ventricosus TaxID=182803 RepID=A0A4Y2CLJ6_ARAVE|nr:hypothetical protein AVEN_60228-1 [Araneus ventricosus]